MIPHGVNPRDDVVTTNPLIVLVESDFGGHIGFWTPFRGDWAAQCVIKFIQQPHLNKKAKTGRSKTVVRRKNSEQIAEMLRVTSHTGLNNYEGIQRMVSHDSRNSIDGRSDSDASDAFLDVVEEGENGRESVYFDGVQEEGKLLPDVDTKV